MTTRGERHVGTSFADADLIESETAGCVYEECDFSGARLNASVHRDSAFLRCTFRRTSLFGASFHGCKFTGSVFLEGCVLRPLTVDGGDWSYMTMRAQDLRGLDFSGVRLRESDLSDSDLRKAVFRGCDMAHVRLRDAQLGGADLRDAVLEAVDLRELDLRGVRLDIGHAVQLAQQLGAEVGSALP